MEHPRALTQNGSIDRLRPTIQSRKSERGTFMKLCLKALICLILTCVALFAQSAATSQISGTIHDPSGSSVAGAQVRAVQTDTGLSRTAETGPDGTYILQSLPTGPYRLEVTKEGFNKVVQTGIILQVASNPAVDITLQVGAVAQE